MKFKRWTKDEEMKAREMLKNLAAESEFMRAFGRTRAAAIHHINYVDKPIVREKNRIRSNTFRLDKNTTKGRAVKPMRVVPEEVIADAVRRNSAERTITQAAMGDPPNGYSALDRKQSAEV